MRKIMYFGIIFTDQTTSQHNSVLKLIKTEKVFENASRQHVRTTEISDAKNSQPQAAASAKR